MTSAHEYDTWVDDDGHLCVTVIPVVWETMTNEAWLRAGRRKITHLFREAGADVQKVPVVIIDRDLDYATDLPLTVTFQSIERYPVAVVEAA